MRGSEAGKILISNSPSPFIVCEDNLNHKCKHVKFVFNALQGISGYSLSSVFHPSPSHLSAIIPTWKPTLAGLSQASGLRMCVHIELPTLLTVQLLFVLHGWLSPGRSLHCPNPGSLSLCLPWCCPITAATMGCCHCLLVHVIHKTGPHEGKACVFLFIHVTHSRHAANNLG